MAVVPMCRIDESIPIEVVIAHIAGVPTDGDFTAAKRIFALSSSGGSIKEANDGALRRRFFYPGSIEPQISSLVEGWGSGGAVAAGQFVAGVIDTHSEFAREDADSRYLDNASEADGRDKQSPEAPSERSEIQEPCASKKESRPVSVWSRSGRTPELRRDTESAMLRALDSGALSLDALASATEKALAAQYGVSRATARKARKAVLAEKDPVLNAAMRSFEQHARDGAIKVYQTAPNGQRWVAPPGLWRPGSLRGWTGGLVLEAGPLAWGKIYPNLEISFDDAKRHYPGFDPGTVGRKRPHAPVRPSRGPRPLKSKAIEDAINEQIERGSLSIQALRERKEEALVAEYGCSRTTVRRAKKAVLARKSSMPE
jgi:hypothetical protein